jgi:hypothetical protein
MAMMLLLVACNPSSAGGSSPSTTPVTQAQAVTAYNATAAMLSAAFLLSTDNGTTSTHLKYKDAGGTLLFDQTPVSGYPQDIIITGNAYNETSTGYVLKGTQTIAATAVMTGTITYALTLTHASEPVTSITGTLTFGATVTGSLTFNSTSYTAAQLGPGSSGASITQTQALTAFSAATAMESASVALPLGSGIDNGSTAGHNKYRNAGSTLFFDQTPTSGYPQVWILTGAAYNETVSGYVLTGTETLNLSSGTAGTVVFSLTLTHATEPVTSITGTLTFSGSNYTGSLTFNSTSFTSAQLGLP